MQKVAEAQDKSVLVHHFNAYIVEIVRLANDKKRIRTLGSGITAKIVDSTPEGLRVQALEELATKGDQKSSDDLIQILSTGPNNCTRWKAAQALGRLHEVRAVEPLKKARINSEKKISNCSEEEVHNETEKKDLIKSEKKVLKACTDALAQIKGYR